MTPEEKRMKALQELSCDRCHAYTALPRADRTKESERTEWVVNKEVKFAVLFPLQERTGKELCYLCQKIVSGLCTA